MNFYTIKNNYIAYLKQFDSKVPDNKNESRPYVGIVLEINQIKYYAPFTSPKPKHLKMRNGKDFRKINNGLYGAINLNNMIPVVDDALILIKIASIKDLKYRRLLQNQYNAIRDDWKGIQQVAQKLYTLLQTPEEQLTPFDRSIKSRCCDIVLLERIYHDYRA